MGTRDRIVLIEAPSIRALAVNEQSFTAVSDGTVVVGKPFIIGSRAPEYRVDDGGELIITLRWNATRT